MSERVVVRKYGNRRLYNTSTSRYINLEELANLVRNGNDVQVLDAKTGEDLTRVTLTQIIVEDAKGDNSGLPLELLRQLIVASNNVAREGFMWFKPALHAFEGAVESSLRKAAHTAFSPLQMMQRLVGTPTAESATEELEQLKKRIEELENRGTRPRPRRKERRPAAARRRSRGKR